MAVVNTLAYCDTATITTVKTFIVHAPWSQYNKTITVANSFVP
jgi:hypothetical protein